MDAGTPVRVVFRKYDGTLHWHQRGILMGRDDYGTWVGCPPGTSARRGDEPPIVHAQAHAMLFPVDAWWTAVFNGGDTKISVYCDISTVPTWSVDGSGSEVTMVDLDLDVARFRADDRVEVLDEDEFACHRVRYGYPEHVVTEAERATAWLAAAVAGGVEPFGTTYRHWLGAAARLDPQ